MKNYLTRALSVIAVAAAVVAVAIAAMVVTENRAEIAKHLKVAAEAAQATANLNAKAAASTAAAAEASNQWENARSENLSRELDLVAKTNEFLKLSIKNNDSEVARIDAEQKLKDIEADIKQSEAEIHTATSQVARASADRARAEADREMAIAAAEKDKKEREQLVNERTRMELELTEKQCIDFAAWAQELDDRQQDLDEREAALKPEMTVADLVWLGYDENGRETNRLSRTQEVLPEDDLSLPAPSRKLAKIERQMQERDNETRLSVRDDLKAKLDEMRKRAASEGRVIDAKYYESVMQSL